MLSPATCLKTVEEQQQELKASALRWPSQPATGDVFIKHFLMKGKEAGELLPKNKTSFMVLLKMTLYFVQTIT